MTVNLCPRRLKTGRDRGTSKEILRAQWPSDPLTYSSSLYYSVTFPSSCSVGSHAAAAVVWHSSLCLWHTCSPRTLLFITTSWSWLLKIICYLGSVRGKAEGALASEKKEDNILGSCGSHLPLEVSLLFNSSCLKVGSILSGPRNTDKH